jgi:Flp pilus assembly pilin Flp
MRIVREFLADERAASMAEYALLLALIAVGTIGAVTVLRNQIIGVFDRTSTELEGAE